MREKMKATFLEYFWIFIGCIPYAAGIALFLDPNDLAPGGVTGIAILVNRLLPIETGSLILLINIPILILGLIKFGFRFLLSTIYALFIISPLTNYFNHIGALTKDRLLAAIVGAALMAVGMGVIFRRHATTGGVDIIVKLLRRKYPHRKTGNLFMMMDSVVIITAGFVFGDIESMIYALIALVVSMYTLDLVLYGRDEAGLIFIISDRQEEITEHLLYDIDLGVTKLCGRGAYTKKEKDVLMCVCQKKQTLSVEEIVKKIDPDAFLIVSHAKEIYGEGYKSLFAEKL